MKDEQHKNIDDVFRRVINDPANEPEYRPDHWDALEEMLNGKKKPVKLVYWLPLASAAAMMLVALGWWYLTPHTAQNANPAQRVVIKKLNGTGTPRQGNVAGLKTDPVGSPDRAGDKMAVFSAGKPARQSSESGSDNIAEQSPVAAVAARRAVKNDDKTAGLINPVNRDARVEMLEQPKQFTLSAAGIANHSIAAVNVVEKAAKISPDGVVAGANDRSWLKRPRLAIAVLTSADVNGVNSLSNANTGKNIGMLISARFNKLSISTGAYYSFKPYTMGFSSYSPNSAYKFRYSPETVTADCRMLDIPINIDYQVFAKNKNSISVGTGISSFIMLKESYQYNYSAPHVYGLSSYNVSNPDKYLFSSVNFQASYQRQVNSKIGLNVMPYVKIPLNDIGYSRVKLQTVGVAVGLNWNINSLSKPK